MATLLLNCGAAISSRIRARRHAKEEREREYAENFEKLQAENEKRVKRLSAMSQQYDLINDPMYNSKALPTYEDVQRQSISDDDVAGRERSGRVSLTQTSQAMSTARPQGITTVQSLRPKSSMVDRRDWAAVASTTTRTTTTAA